MPGKHNAGGCGCCGNPSSCWSCDHPVSLTVVAGAGTCCSSFGATLVFSSDADLSFNLCEQRWSVTKPYRLSMGWGNAAGSNADCINDYCPITSVANDNSGEQYVCMIDSYTTSNPTCKSVVLVQGVISYRAQVRDVATVPTLTVTLSHGYSEHTNTDGISGCQRTNAPRDWSVTDTYESTINCNDATTVLTHTSRVITDPNGSTTTSPITWGYFNEKSYTICAAPTITLSFV